MQNHDFTATIAWTGKMGDGVLLYERHYEIRADGKPTILGDTDPAFGGDGTRHNPENLLVASLSACHMLWYLALCVRAGIVVTAYLDRAEGAMALDGDGNGQFTRVLLRPEVTVAAGSDLGQASALHRKANERCFIVRSVNFPVEYEPILRAELG